jgi:hypothetical protein
VFRIVCSPWNCAGSSSEKQTTFGQVLRSRGRVDDRPRSRRREPRGSTSSTDLCYRRSAPLVGRCSGGSLAERRNNIALTRIRSAHGLRGFQPAAQPDQARCRRRDEGRLSEFGAARGCLGCTHRLGGVRGRRAGQRTIRSGARRPPPRLARLRRCPVGRARGVVSVRTRAESGVRRDAGGWLPLRPALRT